MSPTIPWTAGRWAPIGRCSCGAIVYPDSFRDRASYREATEHQLLCQDCQDRLFFARSEDGDLRYPIRRGVVAAPVGRDGAIVEIGLLPFLAVIPEYRIAWQPLFSVRAGVSLAPLDPWRALEPMREILAGHQVRLTEFPDIGDPKVREAFDVDLVVVLDAASDVALNCLPFEVSAPRGVLSEAIHWTALYSSAVLAPWLGDSTPPSVIRTCALAGLALDPGLAVHPLRSIVSLFRGRFPELSWSPPDVDL